MSFCRITGKAKGLPRPNYFPLLCPISPSEARRYCRITGKAYGLPSHHYIPVLLTTYSNKSKCKITNSTEYSPHHYEPDYSYGRRKHIVLAEYRYMFPVFDESNDQQRDLIDLLNSKNNIQCEEHRYVYPVSERKFSLVFSARLEAAVRDGDVRDVMLAKTNDSVLLRMKQGRNVSLDLHDCKESVLENGGDFDEFERHLYDGEGPREDVLLDRELEEHEQRRQRQLKRKDNLSHMAQIFESKERNDDAELLRKLAIREAKRQKIEAKRVDRLRKIQFNEFNENGLLASTANGLMPNLHAANDADDDWPDLVKPLIESWDWETYEKEASKSNFRPTANRLPTPCSIRAVIIEARNLQIDNELLSNHSGFDAVPCVVPLCPFTEKMRPELIAAIKTMDDEAKDVLRNTNEKLLDDRELFEIIPTQDDIVDIMANYGSNGVIRTDTAVPGMELTIGSTKKVFVTGRVVPTPSGDVFVPGQTVVASDGSSVFMPGITVKSPNDSSLSFVPGAIIPHSKDASQVFFIAGQIVEDEFVFGQTVYTNNEARFVEGQTVVTPDGLKIVVGVLNPETNEFVCGQVLDTPNGPQFIAGQTITTKDGSEQFYAGQCSYNESSGWTFTHGQTINGEFVAGKSVITKVGAKYVAGQYVDDVYVPGRTVTVSEHELIFQPGLNVETKHGAKFVEGQIVRSENGDIFMAGKSVVGANGIVDFVVAKTIDDIAFSEAISNGLVIDSSTIEISAESLSVYGHMVQTKKGIEFYPAKIDVAHLPDGKIVPGKLIRQQDKETKFIPGRVTADYGSQNVNSFNGTIRNFINGTQRLKFIFVIFR